MITSAVDLSLADDAPRRSELEQFVRDYIETIGGVWDEIEPQVYEVLLPDAADSSITTGREPALVHLTFDPEALPEHPRAQLASLGTPLVDRLLADAVERGRLAELHLLGLNTHPHQLAAKAARALTLDQPLALDVAGWRPIDCPQLIFWFEATFASDQREQEILPVAVDLHYGRSVRHLDVLLDASRLAETSSTSLPALPGVGRAAAYRLARDQVLRSVSSLANVRARELHERLERQSGRMTRYYDDLRRELDAQAARAASRHEADEGKLASRRSALEHERQLRIAELRKKNALAVRLRLLNVLVIHQPKLQIEAAVVDRAAASARTPVPALPLALIWDPLVEALEAVPCQGCGRPTFELSRHQLQLVCPDCRAGGPASRVR